MEKPSSILAQRLNVVHKIPDLVRLGIRKRRHRGTIEAGGQVLEQITSGFAALEVSSFTKVEW
jgi:hypothetical protein